LRPLRLVWLFVILISGLVLAQPDRAPVVNQPNGLPVAQQGHPALPPYLSQIPPGVPFAQRRAGAFKAAGPRRGLLPMQGLDVANATTYDPGGLNAVSVAVADVNGDGKRDLLVANSCVSSSNRNNGNVGVLLDNDDGTFQTAMTWGLGGILSPSSLSFGVQLLYKISAVKTIRLINVGGTSLTTISIALHGDFSMPTKTCGTSLAPAASCTLSIAFRPIAIGARTGSVSVSYSGGPSSPQAASLSGTGTELSLSATRLSFGTQVLTNKSVVKSVTLTNIGSTPVTINTVTITGDFGIASNTCGSGLAAGASCAIGIALTPTALGPRTGTLSISHNGGGSPSLINLTGSSIALPLRSEVLSEIAKVNDYWISNNSPLYSGNNWNSATYFRGDMAAYDATGNSSYLDLAHSWANANSWALIGGDTTRDANNQAAGEVYLKLYQIDHNATDITHITTDILAMVNSPGVSDWWWIDALNMAMPSFTNLGVLHSNPSYWSKMYDLYNYTKHVDGGPGLYNTTDHLWFRDQTFLPPIVGPHGKNIYWSRGNGWVFAAHAKVLDALPTTDPHYQEYLTTLKDMAAALAVRQRSDGFWNVDLQDPLDFPGPETSGTSFFVFGMAWGLSHNILSRATYLPMVVTAWDGLVQTAVQPSGFLGYVQGVGDSPSSSQPVTASSTADFGVGAFLLAGAEVAKLAAISQVAQYPTSLDFGNQAVGTTSAPQTVTVANQGNTLLSITKILVTGNFSIQATTCGVSLAAGATCTVTIVFHPLGTGNRSGNLRIYDNGGSLQKVSVTGVGT
jgi:unsaturated rhamnogalacturonyl hydrolase